MDVLQKFEGRIWISNQAANEFIENRHSVIASAEKTFDEAIDVTKKFRKASQGFVEELKKHRLISPDELISLNKEIGDAIDKSQKQIGDAKSNYPDYLQTDPVFEKLADLFDGCIGSAPSADERDKLIAESKDRQEKKIPPGYLDSDKEGDRAHGDYILWSQVLKHAGDIDLPMILVTSENKPDWWERHSGKTIGPRPELLKEASEKAGQRILIYKTGGFTKYASVKFNLAFTEDSQTEIRLVTERRDNSIPAATVHQEVTQTGPSYHSGYLHIDVKRPVRNITGTGQLEPNMSDIPALTVGVVECPSGAPTIHLTAGTGTVFDFNVHVRASDSGTFLPVGQYVVRYSANCSGISVGQRVFHSKFGNGQVVERDGNKLEIEFDSVGSKRVLDSFVKEI